MSCNTLMEIKDTHKGKRAFILGAGPSLNDFDITRITSNDVIFACNRAITAIKYSDYFCMTDGTVPGASFFDYGVNSSKKIVFMGDHLQKILKDTNKYDKIKDKAVFLKRRLKDPQNHNFSTDDGLLIAGTDVGHVTAHLAHIMGCSPIVLVGIDLDYNNGLKYCSAKEYSGNISYIYENKPFSGKITEKGNKDRVLRVSFNSWKLIKEQNKSISFLNASPGSKLSTIFNPFL